MTPDQRQRATELRAKGLTYREIAPRLGVTHTTIRRWVMSSQGMKMYVWDGEGVLQSFTTGMVCVLAPSLIEAREMAAQHCNERYLRPDLDFIWKEPTVFQESAAASVEGGG